MCLIIIIIIIIIIITKTIEYINTVYTYQKYLKLSLNWYSYSYHKWIITSMLFS